MSDGEDGRETESDKDEGSEASILGRAGVRSDDGRCCGGGESVDQGDIAVAEVRVA